MSFHIDEKAAFDHQDKMPDVPPPEKLTAEEMRKQPKFRECRTSSGATTNPSQPIEMRPVELGRYFGEKIEDGRIHVWMRTAAKLPDDPAMHMCALAYASDFALLDTVMARYGRTLFDKRMMPASLDHAMWFHRPFRADEWLLYAQDFRARKAAGAHARPDLQAGRHAGGVGRAGRFAARAQMMRVKFGVGGPLDQREMRSTSVTYQPTSTESES